MIGIRQWSNEHPKTTATAVGVGILVCISFTVANVLAGRHRYPSSLPDFYFTVDDGKSYFRSSSSNFAPFDYNGQTALRAHVFQCGSRTFVGYVERYNSATKALLSSGHQLTAEMITYGRELKKPGEPVWTSSANRVEQTKIQNVKCPDGTGTPDAIEP